MELEIWNIRNLQMEDLGNIEMKFEEKSFLLLKFSPFLKYYRMYLFIKNDQY